MKFLSVGLWCAVCLTAGCTTPVKLAETASGRPEVTISTSDPAPIKAAILNDMLNHGYLVEQDTEYSLALVREIKGGGEGFLAGFTAGMGGATTKPKRVTIYNFVKLDTGIRVVVSSQWRSQSYGSTTNQELAMDGNTFNTFYTQLQEIKAQVERRKPNPNP